MTQKEHNPQNSGLSGIVTRIKDLFHKEGEPVTDERLQQILDEAASHVQFSTRDGLHHSNVLMSSKESNYQAFLKAGLSEKEARKAVEKLSFPGIDTV